MLYVPVVSSTGKPLMPCHPARARELVRMGRAVRRFNQGVFYIKLLDRQDGATQPLAVGIDPGSKQEAFTVKSEVRTFLNIQAQAVTWVKDAVKTRRNLRRSRRFRNTPCRPNRTNRARGGLAPSTRARWGWKLRIATWLSRFYPIRGFMVEDVCAVSKKFQRQWNSSFSPLEVGKHWFYDQLAKIAPVETREGWETKELRDAHGLKKSRNKMAETFSAHCVDSWVLANCLTGGQPEPNNTRLMCLTPLRSHGRQLRVENPVPGSVRKAYGGTSSLGFKRSSLVKHIRHGLAYVGGFSNRRLSLHSGADGRRLGQNFRPDHCAFLTTARGGRDSSRLKPRLR